MPSCCDPRMMDVSRCWTASHVNDCSEPFPRRVAGLQSAFDQPTLMSLRRGNVGMPARVWLREFRGDDVLMTFDTAATRVRVIVRRDAAPDVGHNVVLVPRRRPPSPVFGRIGGRDRPHRRRAPDDHRSTHSHSPLNAEEATMANKLIIDTDIGTYYDDAFASCSELAAPSSNFSRHDNYGDTTCERASPARSQRRGAPGRPRCSGHRQAAARHRTDVRL